MDSSRIPSIMEAYMDVYLENAVDRVCNELNAADSDLYRSLITTFKYDFVSSNFLRGRIEAAKFFEGRQDLVKTHNTIVVVIQAYRVHIHPYPKPVDKEGLMALSEDIRKSYDWDTLREVSDQADDVTTGAIAESGDAPEDNAQRNVEPSKPSKPSRGHRINYPMPARELSTLTEEASSFTHATLPAAGTSRKLRDRSKISYTGLDGRRR